MLALQKGIVAAVFVGDEDALYPIHVFGEQQASLSNSPQCVLAGLVATTVVDIDQSPLFAQQGRRCGCAITSGERRRRQRTCRADEFPVIGAAVRSSAADVVQPERAEQRQEKQGCKTDQRGATAAYVGCGGCLLGHDDVRFLKFKEKYKTNSSIAKLHHCMA